jgi:hypothetical protein
MVSPKSRGIKGSVEKVGSRITHVEDNIIVEEIVRVTIKPTADQKKAFEKDSIGLIKKLLKQEGHKFKDVIDHDPSRPISHLRSALFHIVYDRANPGAVCSWHRYTY